MRIDQTHFNITAQGRVCHVYLQASLSGQFEITEITNPPPVVVNVPLVAPVVAPVAHPSGDDQHHLDLLKSVLEMSGAFD